MNHVVTQAMMIVMRDDYLKEFSSKFVSAWIVSNDGFALASVEESKESVLFYCAGYSI